MIHLVLDSSIFRKSPKLDSREFIVLSEMMDAGQVTLHIPYVVEREITSALEQDQRKRLTAAISSISKAVAYEPLGPKSSELETTLEKLKDNLDDLAFERVAVFSVWIGKHKAVRHAITLEQSNKALEAYFNGDPPLKQPKSRKDIPDSFIFQQIIELKNRYGADLVVVAEDNTLRTACEDISIVSWSDLLKFITSPSVRKFYSEKIIGENITEICEHVIGLAKIASKDIAEVLEKSLLSDEFRMLYGNNFPGEDGEIYLSGINVPHRIDVEDMEYIGKRIFMGSIHAEVELMYEFSLPIYDAMELDEDKYSASPLNDYYSEVETTDAFHFSARIELEFPDSNMTVQTLEELKSSLQEPLIKIGDLQNFELIDDIE